MRAKRFVDVRRRAPFRQAIGCSAVLGRPPRGMAAFETGSADTSPAMTWLQCVLLIDDRQGWRERARESIVDLNDGIVSAAGIAEGFAAAGASTRALVFAGATVVLTGGFAAAASSYSEERTEWEMNHRLVEAERASIEA